MNPLLARAALLVFAAAGAVSAAPQVPPAEVSAPILERLGDEVQAARDKARRFLAHVEVRVDESRDLNYRTAGVLVDAEHGVFAVPYHPAHQVLDRAYVRLLDPRAALFGCIIGSAEDGSASFVQIRIGDALAPLAVPADAPKSSSEPGAFYVLAAPLDSLDEVGALQTGTWIGWIQMRGVSQRGRAGLLRLRPTPDPAACGGVLVDPRGRLVAFVPCLDASPPPNELREGDADEESSAEREEQDPASQLERKLAELRALIEGGSAQDPAASLLRTLLGSDQQMATPEYAVPIQRLRASAERVRLAFEQKYPDGPPPPPPSWIGIYIWRPEYGDASESQHFEPFQILEVFEGSPARRAGVRPGDVFVALNEVPLASSDSIARAMETTRQHPQGLLRIRARRGQEVLELEVELGPLPASTSPSKQGDKR